MSTAAAARAAEAEGAGPHNATDRHEGRVLSPSGVSKSRPPARGAAPRGDADAAELEADHGQQMAEAAAEQRALIAGFTDDDDDDDGYDDVYSDSYDAGLP